MLLNLILFVGALISIINGDIMPYIFLILYSILLGIIIIINILIHIFFRSYIIVDEFIQLEKKIDISPIIIYPSYNKKYLSTYKGKKCIIMINDKEIKINYRG